MKKIVLFTLALVFAVTSVNAQNRWFGSGSVDVYYSKTKDLPSWTDLTISPSIHYMLNDNWAIGGSLTYNRFEHGSNVENTFGIEPSLIYFRKLGDKFYYTPEFSIFYEYTKENKENTFGATVSPLSFEFRPTDCLGITMAAGDLSFESSKPKGGVSTSTLHLGFNSFFSLGLRFYF